MEKVMPKYRVNTGYHLHLPYGRVAGPGEEVELTGDLEQEVLKNQGWKVTLLTSTPANKQTSGPEEAKAIEEPPKDRAAKRAKVK
jgi:hypothetical protein